MLDAEVEAWLTGLPSRSGPACGVAVVSGGAAADAVAALRDVLGGGLGGDGDGPRDSGVAPAGRARELLGVADGADPRSADEFAGRFEPDRDVTFGDGFRLRVRHYGTARFVCLDGPTALVIRDGEDLSAYLRDADDAWLTGRFAEHATHPQAVIADLAALGGPADGAGPEVRIYLGDDGLVRTSPAGAVLGAPAHGMAALATRWRRLNAAGAWPDSCCLAGCVSDDDRVPALLDRPWIRRYVTAALAVRGVRRRDRVPCRVSGFGGRLALRDGGAHPADARGGAVDPDDAPVLVRVGAYYRAIDPSGGASTRIDVARLEMIEALLAGAGIADVTGAGEACRDLIAAGVAPAWCRREIGESADAREVGQARTSGAPGPYRDQP